MKVTMKSLSNKLRWVDAMLLIILVVVVAIGTKFLFLNPTQKTSQVVPLASGSTYATSSSPLENLSNSPLLRTDTNPLRTSYVQFSVSTVGTYTDAIYKVYANQNSAKGFSLYSTPGSWTPSSVNFNHKPVLGAKLGTSGPIKKGSWVSVDVSSDVKTAGTFGFAMVANDNTAVTYNSATAASNRPQLVVTYSSATPPPPPPPPPTSVVRAAFYYPWFPNAWNQLGINPYTNYHPSLGFYSSNDPSVIKNHIAAMQYGHLNAGIISWWGQGSQEDSVVPADLAAANGTGFKWSLYYEAEGTSNPSVAQIQSDLSYIKSKYAGNPNFLTINNKPVIFVYGQGTDTCANYAQPWSQANASEGFYTVLKVFSGYASCASDANAWHQYGPASAEDHQTGYSFTISPGFNKKAQASPFLARNLATWVQNIKDMVASNEPLQLVTTFNEWGEGTAVESATEWASASGYGSYLDALHNNIPGSSTTATAPTAPTNLAATALSSTSVKLTWSAATDKVGVTGYDIYRGTTKLGSVGGTTLTYTDATAAPSTSYSYTVDATNAASLISPASNAATVTTPASVAGAPSAPTNLHGTALSGTQINLTWTASTGSVGGYIVFRGGTQIADTKTTGTSYSDIGLKAGTSYTYTVLAYAASNTALKSAQSSPVTVATLPPPPPTDTTPPSVPTAVSATLVAPTTDPVHISWGASTDNTGGSGMKLYIIVRTDAAGNKVNFTTPTGTTTLTDSSTLPGTKYTYTVAAEDNANNVSAASIGSSVTTPTVTTPDTQPPDVPVAHATVVSTTQVTISWAAVADNPKGGGASGVKGYLVFRNGTQIANVATTSANDGPFSFVQSQSYSYTVLAYDVAGNKSAQSAASSVVPNPVVTTAGAECGNPATGNKIDTVIVIAEENRTWAGGNSPGVGLGFKDATMPYTHALAAQCTYFNQDTETDITQNSATQYAGAWTGLPPAQTHVAGDCPPSASCSWTSNNIFRAFRNAGIPHREYVEGATAACSSSGNVPRHIPELYAADPTDKANCANEVLPLTQFNFASPPTGFTFITPTLCNDGHDCSDTVVDNWLSNSSRLPALFNSAAYKSGRVFVDIWWDEDHPRPNVFACWSCKQSVNTTVDPHATGESLLWLNLLGAPSSSMGGISSATDIRPILGTP
jgi:chitodextrinase